MDAVPDFAAWEAKTAHWVGEGAATGARLLVFPEYGALEIAAAAGREAAASLTGSLAAVADRMEAMDRVHARLAREHGVHILAASGPRRRADGRFVNSARLITPGGRIGVQDKLIMTPFEHAWGVVAGGPPRVFVTALGTFGVAICYDSEFPLLVRSMVEAGAEVLLIPSCTEWLSGFYRIRAGATARALENQIATVTSPTIGLAAWSPAVDRNTGAAGLFVPPDRSLAMTGVIAEGAVNDPGWIVGDIDFAGLHRLRTGGEMRNRADWALQPGAGSGRLAEVDVVDLR